MDEYVKAILGIIAAIAGIGIVLKLISFKFRKNHIAVGKNVDNSYVAPGAHVNKMVGDNNTMNVGTQIYYQDEEPEINGEQAVWIGGKEEKRE